MPAPNRYLWEPAPVPSLPVHGDERRLPVNRLFFVGRNYLAHAAEMGISVDKGAERPMYFTKSPQTLTLSGTTIPYPPETTDFHYEMELVVAIGKAGFRVDVVDAHELVYGYACGLDMTRRDLQRAARERRHPWDLAKNVEHAAVISEIVPMSGHVIDAGRIELSVNGQIRQQSDIGMMIWNIREIIADLSRYYHLQPGDLIYTGTPEGVGPVVPGDRLAGSVEGVGEIVLTIGEPAGGEPTDH